MYSLTSGRKAADIFQCIKIARLDMDMASRYFLKWDINVKKESPKTDRSR